MASTNWIDVWRGYKDDVRSFVDDVRVEWRKIAWPSQNETVLGALSVLVVVAIIAVVLGIVDLALSEVMSRVLP